MSSSMVRKTRNTTTGPAKNVRKAGTARRATAKAELRLLTTPEERHRLIREAAYLKAEQRGFEGGSPEQDWFEAEAEVDAALANRS